MSTKHYDILRVLLIIGIPFIVIFGFLFLFLFCINSIISLYVLSKAGLILPNYLIFVFKFAPFFVIVLISYLILLGYKAIEVFKND